MVHLMDWKRLPSSPLSRYDAVGTNISKKGDEGTNIPIGVVVVGGRTNNTSSVSDVELLEWNVMRWWKLPPLTIPRCGCAVASIHDTIFVMGGCSEQQQQQQQHDPNDDDHHLGCSYQTGERFAFGSSAWEPITNMISKRWHCSAASLPEHNVVIVVGGRDECWKELDSVEAYDNTTNEWKSLSSMKCRRFGCTVAAINSNEILVIGGYNGKEWLSSIELYNYTTNTWSIRSSMPETCPFGVSTTIKRHDDGGTYVFVVQRDDGPTIATTPTATITTTTSSRGDSYGTMYCYHADRDNWTVVRPFDRITGNALTVLDNHLVAIGGYDLDTDDRTATYAWNFSNSDFERLWKNNNNNSITSNNSHVITSTRETVAASGTVDTCTTTATATTANSSSENGCEPSDDYNRSDVTDTSSSRWVDRESDEQPRETSLGVGSLSDGFEDRSKNTSPSNQPAVVVEQGVVHKGLPINSPFGEEEDSTEHSITENGSLPTKTSSDTPKCPSLTVSKRLSGRRRFVENEIIQDKQGTKVLYTGQLSTKTDRPHGQGKMIWQFTTGDEYVGCFRNGSRDGHGRMNMANGDVFEGIYKNDKRDGRGTYKYKKDGRQYDGMYVDDVQEDPNGTMTWKDGTTYVGQFLASKRTGKGIVYFPSNVRYNGDFLAGRYHGHGECKFADGSMYVGQWKKGKAHGHGCYVNSVGDVLHDGKWFEDSPVESS